ncbi:cell division cycle protein 16 homolog [Scaptodrosophila lebanonensis]|uniref:Cell division cycle protein 16 homolog n=1 Tax=Drosophila lebanonensis TaxID=7225 RepID=A0A6J2T0C2_DROLE|nr:cell division cycle protein 16 homolog [Scaptodrosophila lebanonensis]XP_030371794.1 cell division cycle protein 16 homolog [Scaptodrosophila lebanonensis]
MAGDNESNSAETTNEQIDLAVYRKLVKQFIDMRRYSTALFWAEKVAVLSGYEPRDVYYHAQCMFLLGEFHRAAHTIQHYKLEKNSLPCFNLLLESLYAAKEYNEAANIIQSVEVDLMTTSLINQPVDAGSGCYLESNSVFAGEENNRNELLASIYLMKGKVYEALDNRGMAMDFYVQALHKSIYCFEALEALVQHEMLMAWEEFELMHHLPLAQQSSEVDAKFILKLYESRLKKYYELISTRGVDEISPIVNPDVLKYIKEVSTRGQPQTGTSETQVPKPILVKFPVISPAQKVLEDLKVPTFSLQTSLSRASSMIDSSHRSYFESSGRRRSRDNDTVTIQLMPLAECMTRVLRSTDLMAAEAEKCFYDCDYKHCLKILNDLLKIDPFHNNALTIQIACLVENGDFNKLFYVAHKLVDRYPDKAISWYAVGCYYDMIGKSDPARRYLSKATALDRLYGPAWLAYGHSFANENEHEQAMAAYFKATQLMRGCHLPLLYIGVECGLTKNLELAEKFFLQAMTIAPLDVYVLHELGVIKYEYEYYEGAATIFHCTVDLVSQRAKANNEEISARWEPLYINLGHSCRKIKKYEEALYHFQYALVLKPQNPTTYTSIGFIHALLGNLDKAIEYFHKSLALNRDCIVTSTILKGCIEDLMDDNTTIDEICSKALKKVSKSTPAGSQRAPSADKFNGVKLKFDEDELTNSDSNMIVEMSFET